MIRFHLSAFADESSQSFDGQLKNIGENRIRKIELRGVDGKSCIGLTDDEAREVRRKMDDAGVTLSALGSPYGKIVITDDFSAHMDSFRRGLDICKIVGADKIRMFSFYMPKGEEHPENWKNKVTDQLWQMVEAADDAGIRLCHENEKGIYGDIDSRVLELMDEFGDRLGWIFDPANYIQCGVNCREAFPKQLSRLTYMHIKDAFMADGAVVPAGKGDGSLEFILSTICQSRTGDMLLTIEPHLAVFSGLQNLQAEEVAHHYSYPSSEAAFKAACDALKEILRKIGCNETECGVWTYGE